MPFERQDDECTSVLIQLRGKPLDYVMSLKAQYLQKFGKDLHKGDAISYLLNKIPRKVIKDAIGKVLEEHQKDKKTQKRIGKKINKKVIKRLDLSK